MRKSARERLIDAKRKKHSLVEMNSIDDLLRLLACGHQPPEERALNPTQRAFIYSPARIKAYKGPAGCAKTSTLCAAILARAILEPGTKYLIARHDYNDLVDTTALRMTEMLELLPPGTLLERDKSPPMKWYIRPASTRLPDGSIDETPSQITFMGLKDNPGGYEFTAAAVDEADEVPEQRIHWINSRLRYKGNAKSIMMAFNPPDVNHWLYTACTGLNAQGQHVEKPWIDLFEPEPKENVRNLDADYYQILTQSLPEDMRQRLVDGQWGSVFPGDPVIRQFRRSIHVRDRIEFVQEGTLFRFWDFGYQRPCCLWAQVTQAGQVRVLRELLGKQQEASDFGKQVLARTAEWFPDAHRFLDYGDPAVKQRKDTGQTLAVLYKEGIHIQSKHHSFDLSMALLRRQFERLVNGEPAIIIDRRHAILLINALSGGYHLKDDGITPHKDGFYDHEVDALRYGVDNVLGASQTGVTLPLSIAYDPSTDQRVNVHEPELS
jgi:hypothetical protein